MKWWTVHTNAHKNLHTTVLSERIRIRIHIPLWINCNYRKDKQWWWNIRFKNEMILFCADYYWRKRCTIVYVYSINVINAFIVFWPTDRPTESYFSHCWRYCWYYDVLYQRNMILFEWLRRDCVCRRSVMIMS